MIESVFRRLKNSHLYFVNLLTFESLENQTNFYFEEANNKIPLLILGGATPHEKVSGIWNQESIDSLKNLSLVAKQERMTYRKSLNCSNCWPGRMNYSIYDKK